MTTDLDTALANAQLPERTVPTCLRGDLQATCEDLQRQLDLENAKPDPDSLAGNPRVAELTDAIEDLREQMEAATVVLRVRGLPNKVWQRMAAEHPPREDNALDAMYGCNFETLAPLLVRRTLTPPVDDAQWERLYEVLSNGQFETLFLAAHAATRGRVSIPKSSRVSAARARPDET